MNQQLEVLEGVTVMPDAALRLMSESRSLVPDLGAPDSARRVLDRISSELEADVFSRCTLAVTELVTNSVKHAGLGKDQRIGLEIVVLPECLRVEVTDAGEGFEWAGATPAPSQESGWGLLLVDAVAARWGVDCSHQTRVWCEFDRRSD